jgi:serine/threonine-protein phosphatase PGAM5
MACRFIYLVRHGQYKRLSAGELEGDSATEHAIRVDGGLTTLGIEQSKLTAQRLRSHPISAIYSSSLPRAIQTAEIIAQVANGIPLRKTRILWECIPCVPPFLSTFLSDVTSEEIARSREQAEEAYERYFKPARGKDKHEILVCHGNLMRYFVCRALGVEPEAWGKMGVFNCGISQVAVSHRSTGVVCHNDSGHLPEDKRTAN